MNIQWHSGYNNYRKHTLTFGETNIFETELLDVEVENFVNVQAAFAAHLTDAKLPVEILYSGGLDSECVLISCIQNKIPAIAVTMRLMFRGAPFNVNDLYYSEKFCRENNIRQVFYDLDIESFFDNGDHIPYMEEHRITMFTAATILWLIDQCHSFPVVGGDHTWPQTNIGKKVYSPHRHDYNCHDRFMRIKGIDGIGNMISHSLESNCFFIKEHLNSFNDDPRYKVNMLYNLGFGELEYRHRSHGWETIRMLKYDWNPIIEDLEQRFGKTESFVKWNNVLAELIEGEPGENNTF